MLQFIRCNLVLWLCLLCAGQLWAQTLISGTVSDAKTKEPLAGTTIVLKGTNQTAVSDIDGTYQFRNASSGTLVFSYVGYQTQEMAIDGKTTIDVALTPSWILGDELVVIGSRNQSRSKMEVAVPVDVIPVSEVSNSVGQVDVNQLLTYIAPSFQSARQAISDGTDHVDPAQLRGLGPDQVLVLVNGKRRHQSALVNVNGTVNRGTVGTDMSAIPVSAIERIEILRDGAAAQYGSDAIAGVVNIVLKKTTGKIGATVSYGLHVTEYDKNFAYNTLNGIDEDPAVSVTDGNTAQVGINYGFRLGDKGFINLTGEYLMRDYTNRAGLYTGQIYPRVNNVIKDDSILLARGLDRNDFDMRIGNSAVKGGGILLNGDYNLNNRWTLYAFGGFNKKNGNAAGFFRYPNAINSSAKIHAAEVLALYPDGFLPEISSDVSDWSLAAGIRGKLGAWNLDISNTVGQNTFDFTIENSVNYTQAAVASDLQTTFDAGGSRFLQNTTNADLSRRFDVMQGLNVAAGAEFRFEEFAIRAGEESSYANYDIPSTATAGAQVFSGFTPENANTNSRNAIGLYTDVELDLTQKLLVGGALRFENYSDFGSTFNYKAIARYRFGKAFTVRASVSSGFRAPSLQQRFYARTSTIFVSQGGNLVPVESGTFTNDSDPAQILGIPSLKQETWQHYAVGFTAAPVQGLEVTVDAYMIDIDDRIVLTNNFDAAGDSTLAAQLAAANASAANFFSNAVDTRSRGLEAVLAYNTSVNSKHKFRFTVAGSFIDNEVKKDADGKPIIKASPILEQTGQIAKYFNREDQSRIEVASPRQKISATIDYKIGKFGVMLRGVHFGKVVYLDPTINPADTSTFVANAFDPPGPKQTLDQTFGAKAVFDLALSYELVKGIRLTVGANNLFDTYQDRHTHSSNMSSGRFVYSRRVQQFGFNGRYLFARLKFDL
ncbi:MAG: TonB-dependent receptor [Sphingobacteriales bacterium]|nr:TonB-dependent receptor [Sphingobacteriales bacterium]